MAVTVASLQAVLSLEKGSFDRDISSASKSVSGLGGVLQGVLAVAGGNLLSGAITGVAKAIGGLGQAAAGFVKEGISSNAQFEDFSTRFEVLLGSAGAAQERMEELAEFGKRTPFELPGVVQADLILQSFGFHSEEAAQKFGMSGEQIREVAGNVASGTGAKFEEIAGYLGRFASGATGEAIMRFQELGIVTREQMSNMGLEFSKAGQLMSPVPEAMTVVLQMMEEKYGGLMDAQSQTFGGLMSNLMDWKDNTIREITAPIFELLRDRLSGFVTWLSGPQMTGLIEKTVKIVTNLFGGFRYIIDNIVIPGIMNLGGMIFSQGVNPLDAFSKFINYKVLPTLTQFSRWFFETGAPAVITFIKEIATAYQSGGIEGVIGKLIGVLQNAWPNIQEKLSSWASRFWDWVTGKDGVLAKSSKALDAIMGKLWEWALSTNTQGTLSKLGAGVTTAFLVGIEQAMAGNAETTIAKVFRSLLNAVMKSQSVLVEIGTAIAAGIVQGFANYFGVKVNDAKAKSMIKAVLLATNPIAGLAAATGVPSFAEGGTVPGSLGSPQLIMAHGGEVVTPVGQRGGGGVSIGNINVYGVQNPKQLYEAIAREARYRGVSFAAVS